MSWTAKAQGIADGVRRPQHINDLLPHRYVRISICVANKIHPMLSTAEKDIDTIRRPQESDLFLFVASDEGHDDDFGFFTLEVIDRSNSQEFTEFLLLQRCFLLTEWVVRLPVPGTRSLGWESVFLQLVLVPVTEDNLEIVSHRRTERLKLAAVRRQDSNVTAVVLALADNMANQ